MYDFGRMNKVKKWQWGLLFVVLCALCFLYPYTGDDWAWGSSIGIERLNTWFDNYSGRYFGNLIVLALTRSNILKTIVMSACITLIVWMITKTNEGKWQMATLVTILIFTAPKAVIRQSIVWTAGFSNYTTSIVLILLYGLFVRNLFIEDGKKHSNVWAIPMLILGFLTTLIVEHVTILAVIMAVYIIAFNFIKNRKIELSHVAYFVGTIAGTATMFSNSVYSSIGSGSDGYRTVGASEGGTVERIITNYFDVIGKEMLFDNIVLCVVMAIVVLIAFIQHHDKLESNMAKIVSCISLTLVMGTLVYGIVTRVDTEWIYNWKYGKYLDGVFNVIFWISLFVLVLSLFKDKYVKYRLSFILGCIACVSGPLLMVTPIGPRCFFATFVLTIWFIAEVCNLVNINEDIYGILTKMEIAALVIVMGMQFAVYAPVYKADRARLDKVRKAESEGKSEVTIQRLPYEGYIHAPSPSEEIWEYRYKLFYNISQDLKIKVVEHKY